jgi:hypothetical protein
MMFNLRLSVASFRGDKRSYLKQPEKWRSFDAAIFDALACVPDPPSTSDLRRVEAEVLIPDATFFNEFTPVSRLRSRFLPQAVYVGLR